MILQKEDENKKRICVFCNKEIGITSDGPTITINFPICDSINKAGLDFHNPCWEEFLNKAIKLLIKQIKEDKNE